MIIEHSSEDLEQRRERSEKKKKFYLFFWLDIVNLQSTHDLNAVSFEWLQTRQLG